MRVKQKRVIASEAKQSPALGMAKSRWLEIAASPPAPRNDGMGGV
jgi:hypothetical protein